MKCPIRTLIAAVVIAAMFATLPVSVARAAEGELKELKAESLGQPIRGMPQAQSFLVPKPGDAGYYLITSYNSLIRNSAPTYIAVIDLDEAKVVLSENRKPSGALWRMAIGEDGRAYMGCYGHSGLYVFDPKDASLQWHPFPEVDKRLQPMGIAIAPNDGKVYYGTASALSNIIEYDPATEAFRDFGRQGPKEKWPRGVYTLAVDDNYVYSAVGKNPWYLVATDRKTLKQEVLFDHVPYITVSGEGDACHASIQLDEKNKERTYFHLQNGKAVKLDGRPAKKSKRGAGRVYSNAAVQPHRSKEPYMNFGLARADARGTAQIWWRMDKKADWQSVTLTGIEPTPLGINTIAPMPDGRIIGAPRLPEDGFIYDPAANKVEVLGKMPLGVNEIECIGDKVYLCGYHGSYVAEYDPARPWTYFTGTPIKPEPELTAPESNPRECHRWSTTGLKTHHIHGTATGSDGWLYFAAHAERLDVGGAIGWWDTVERKPYGLRRPFEVQDAADLAAARNGDLMVYSSHPVRDPSGKLETPKDAKLFLFDVKTKKLVGEAVPMPGMKTCGHIVAEGDLVYGFGVIGEECRFYVYDLAKGETVHNEALKHMVDVRPARGRDGMYYLFIGNELARLDPKSFALTPIGSVKATGQLIAVGRDIYWPSGATLLRLRNIVR